VKNWELVEGSEGLKMVSKPLRAMGDEEFTWAHLLYGKLGTVELGVFYFPSRFDTDVDESVIKALRTFGNNSGAATSVNIWDTKDPAFDQALSLFNLKTVPAVVLATGLEVKGMQQRGPVKTPLYSIILSDPATLSDITQFQTAINSAHEVLARSDPKEITGDLRAQTPNAILEAIGKIGAKIRDEILKWKPKFGLPGGVSVQVG